MIFVVNFSYDRQVQQVDVMAVILVVTLFYTVDFECPRSLNKNLGFEFSTVPKADVLLCHFSFLGILFHLLLCPRCIYLRSTWDKIRFCVLLSLYRWSQHPLSADSYD